MTEVDMTNYDPVPREGEARHEARECPRRQESSHRPKRVKAVWGLALLATVSLAACGGDGGTESDPSASVSAAPQSSASGSAPSTSDSAPRGSEKSDASGSGKRARDAGGKESAKRAPQSGSDGSATSTPESGSGGSATPTPESGKNRPSKRTPKARATASRKTAPVSQARVAPRGLPEIPEVRDASGALADISAGECSTKPGDIEVAGTVRNPTEEATDYAITVSWINDRSDVRGRAVATVKDLAPGRSAEWSARTKLEPDNATQCTFFVERGNLAG